MKSRPNVSKDDRIPEYTAHCCAKCLQARYIKAISKVIHEKIPRNIHVPGIVKTELLEVI